MFKNILQDKLSSDKKPGAGSFLLHQANRYLSPVQQSLDQQIDKRLVSPFYDLFVTVLVFRNRAMGCDSVDLIMRLPEQNGSVTYCVVKNGQPV